MKPNSSAGLERPESEVIGEAYDSLFEHSLDCVKLVDRDGRLLRINQCGCKALEVATPEDAVGKSYFAFWSGSDESAARKAAEEARETGSGRFTGLYRSSSGKITFWDEVLTALPDGDGTLQAFLIVSRNITELKMSLRQQRALADLGSIALARSSFDDFLTEVAATLARVLHCPLTKVLQFSDDSGLLFMRAGVGWREGLIGKAMVGVDRDSQAGYTLLVNEPVIVRDLATEKRFSGPLLLRQHDVKSGMSVVIQGYGARPFGVLGVHSPQAREFAPADIDFLQSVANMISSRWRQECIERDKNTVLRELAHRAGNLLQVADSIFRQTIEGSNDLEVAKRNYSERLAAMARSCSSIARGGWEEIGIESLAMETLKPFGDCIRFSGGDVVVGGELAFDLGLILHELATNSAKYGALREAGSPVDLNWSLLDNGSGNVNLVLTWADSVPSLRGASSSGSGFGTVLIEQLVKDKHLGRISVTEAPNYMCVLEIPYS